MFEIKYVQLRLGQGVSHAPDIVGGGVETVIVSEQLVHSNNYKPNMV